MERLLVTGVDGPLGMNLAVKLAEQFEVIGLYSRHAVESPCFRAERWPAGDARWVAERARQWRPRWMLHCGPLSASAWDPPADDAICMGESRLAAGLAEIAADVGARLTVISSDAVFTGPRMFHDETSVSSNPSLRAAQVRAMEKALAPSRTLVVRTHAYGWSPVEAHADFAQRACESLWSGAPAPADGMRHATPILATDLADLLLRAYELRLHGLYHLAGAERASPWRFVCELATALSILFSCERFAASPGSDGWAHETSLASKRARRELEMTTPMLREGLVRFAEQRHNGWRDQCRAQGPVDRVQNVAA